jgi:type IV fimbrial biogenesis protein FimT
MGSAPATGFTMIELMVVVIVLAVLVGVAVPGFQAVMNGNRLAGASNELVASLQVARMEAVKRNARVGMCLSANANAAADTVECGSANADGWIVFADVNKNGKYDKASDELLRSSTIPPKVVVQTSETPDGVVVFRSDGFAHAKDGSLLNGTIDACIATKRPPENVRHVTIAAGSRVSIAPANGSAKCEEPADTP